MIILPLQYDGHRGPDAVGQHKLTFTMDESIDVREFNPMSIRKGAQFLVTMVEVGTDEAKTFAQETKEETLGRFKKHFEALISDIAKMKNEPEFREQLKADLIEQGVIKKSTSELDLAGYSKQIVSLRKIKFDLMSSI
jgi:hypothetical protein